MIPKVSTRMEKSANSFNCSQKSKIRWMSTEKFFGKTKEWLRRSQEASCQETREQRNHFEYKFYYELCSLCCLRPKSLRLPINNPPLAESFLITPRSNFARLFPFVPLKLFETAKTNIELWISLIKNLRRAERLGEQTHNLSKSSPPTHLQVFPCTLEISHNLWDRWCPRWRCRTKTRSWGPPSSQLETLWKLE